MDLKEYQARLERLTIAAQNKAAESIIVPAAGFLLASIKNRIMIEGKNSAGASIGVYSTKEMYATPEQFIKKQKGIFQPQGKTGKGPFKNGNIRRSMFLPQGYKQLRAIQGRPVDVMNYNYTGDTMLAYEMEPKADRVLLGLTNERAKRIRQGLEAKRGKAFYATADEMAEYDKEVREQSALMTTKILSGA